MSDFPNSGRPLQEVDDRPLTEAGCAMGGEIGIDEVMPPQPTNSGRAYSIHIEPLNFGYMVRVGCQSFAIESTDKLVTALAAYLAEPEKVQNMWFAGQFLR